MTAVTHPRTPAIDLSPFRGGRFYIWLTLFALALAAFSLLYPSTPSYDPWSWLVWGHEILHGSLHIAGGSSWKPLPVIFTTVLALFGSAQPNLWLLIARAGAVLSVLLTAKLAIRITWALTLRGREDGWFTALGLGGRLATIAPSLLAGGIALVGTTFTNSFPGNMLLGYSEGVMVAATLIAVERAWDGHHRQAFALGLLPSLDRPEFWVIWGPYGLWLMWRDRRAIPLVVGLGVLMLLLWVVPQKLGGGSVTGLGSHALHNHSHSSAIFSSFPLWTEMSQKVWPLVLERVEFAALIQMAVTVYLVARARGRLGGWWNSIRDHGAAVAAALASTAGFLWWVLISIETQAGFAGNPRYAILGVMLVYIGGASAYGWACVGIARLLGIAAQRGWLPRWGAGWGQRATAGTVVMLAVYLFVPTWFTHRMLTIQSIRYDVRYQAQLREGVSSLIAEAGGAKRVMACGSVMAENYQVTMVAWYLGVPIRWIQASGDKTRVPKVKLGPNVVFQNSATSGAPLYPTPAVMAAWERGGSHYRVLRRYPVTMYMDCAPYSKT